MAPKKKQPVPASFRLTVADELLARSLREYFKWLQGTKGKKLFHYKESK